MDEQDGIRFTMTTENNITITMQDVDVVRTVDPIFNKELLIAAASRMRAEMTQNIEQEATKKAKK
jgi:hypothetical protein